MTIPRMDSMGQMVKRTSFKYQFAGGEANCFPGTFDIRSRTAVREHQRPRDAKRRDSPVDIDVPLRSDRLAYATWSTGFRPGDTNIVANVTSTRRTTCPISSSAGKPSGLTDVCGSRCLFLEQWKDTQLIISGPTISV